jgi:spore coat protein U-like protein
MRFRFLLAMMLLALPGPSLLFATAPARAAALCDVSPDPVSLDLGDVDTLSDHAETISSEIHISCTGVSDGIEIVTVCGFLGAGTAGATGGTRILSGSDSTLSYGLYADDHGSQPWGDGTALGEPQRLALPVSGNSAAGDIAVYGLASGPASTLPGHYSSTLGSSDAIFYYAEGDTLQCTAPDGPSASTTLTVDADVEPNCLVTTGTLDFGAAGVIDHPIEAQSDIGVTCTPGTQFQIALDGGSSNASSPEERLMHSGSNSITYGLYSDMGRNQPWGEDMQAAPGDGLGEARAYTVYGRVPPQPAPVGSYTDTVVVTIFYTGD